MERIIDVYYGSDNLPYKDEECTIHFPVAGSEFLGASQTTTIRFYYSRIGNDSNVYTVESKRADGKTGSQLLSVNSTEHYAEMSLSGWYSACKGDLFLSLKVYQGGSTATYDETSQLWVVSGVPVIESTGAIKLAINYTPVGRVEDYNDDYVTYQQVLSALGDKISISNGIVVVNSTSEIDTTQYENGQLFINTSDKALYQLDNGSVVSFLEVYSKSETDTLLNTKADRATTYTITDTNLLLNEKVDKITGSWFIKKVYAVDNTTQTSINASESTISNAIPIRDNNGQLSVPTTPTSNTHATSKAYVDTKQDKLYSGVNIKTLTIGNNLPASLLGSGTINIPTGGSGGDAEWGSIGGNIADQTDLQNEFQNIREVAEGKCKTWVLSYQDSLTDAQYFNYLYYDPTDGEFKEFEDATQFNTWKSGLSVVNSTFNLQNDLVNIALSSSNLLIFKQSSAKSLLVKVNDALITGSYGTPYKLFKRGDVFLVVETPVPDRWYNGASASGMELYKLETSKVDLDNYSTKTYTDTEDNKVAHDIAVEYDPDTLYGSGDLCIKDKLLYKCNTDNTTGTWDSTKWDLTTVNSELGVIKGNYVTTDTAQTITSTKIIDEIRPVRISPKDGGTTITLGLPGYDIADIGTGEMRFYKQVFPRYDNTINLGRNIFRWKEFYVAGNISDGTNQTTVAKINNNFAPTYDSTATYSVGDLCIYQGTLYKCITAISTAEAFDSTHWSAISVNSGFAKKEEGFNVIYVSQMSAINTLSEAQKNLLINGKQTQFIGTTIGHINMLVLNYDNSSKVAIAIGLSTANSYMELFKFSLNTTTGVMTNNTNGGSVRIATGSNVIDIVASVLRFNGKNFPDYPTTNPSPQYLQIGANGGALSYNDPFTPTSVSISDGGTISDTTLQANIKYHRPIVLNGFTCYFSCDDGTNYQYVSTRYDSVANKNHINVITIDKSTWVATFHTSDIAV